MKLDWKEYESIARRAVAEGVVLLKNEKQILPLQENSKIALFGRMQNHYYKSGTGSGGMVNVKKVWSILDALREEKVVLNADLLAAYEAFEADHPFDGGVGFGNEPWSQVEMELSEELAKKAAIDSDLAVVIIGRTAGEEQDYQDAPGAYRLSEVEKRMLETVRKAFDRMLLIMNVSAVLDMQEIAEIAPDAILYAWQGGEMGGLGTADVLMGRVCPSGRLTDTIVDKIENAPAFPNFGDPNICFYEEDIYVGYRYYESFHPEVVRYPFGFGLSYTAFADCAAISWPAVETGKDCGQDPLTVTATVENVGQVTGREVVQIYVSAPQGQLGKPSLALAAFGKTKELEPGEKEELQISFLPYVFASYDETGKTGYTSAYVLEAGTYRFYLGKDAAHVEEIGVFTLQETVLVKQHTKQMSPIRAFSRLKPGAPIGKGDLDAKKPLVYEIVKEDVPTGEAGADLQAAMADRPDFAPYAGNLGIKLVDVRDGKADMATFLSQLSDEDLSAIIRGEGMGSPKVTAGTAAAFGGVSPALKQAGIPCGCCSDGPSGMRLDCGTRAFSLPNGTLLACTWDEALNEELYRFLGMEMTKNHVDVLLGPGMNIHRHPLNGRNFEYFSEDPLITGKMAAAQIRGMQKSGVTGTLKHFCGNNQEKNRHGLDSIISERALREIYLKGFEIAVLEGHANSVMTTYGSVNGSWTNGRHDLNTELLRNEWGFKGIVMTDWWANIGDVGGKVSRNDFARLVLAQNDFYAVCPDGSTNSTGDNTLEALAQGRITRGQLLRCAANICGLLMHTNAMKRMNGEAIDLEVLNLEEENDTVDPSTVPYYEISDGTVIDLSDCNTEKGSSIVLGFDVPGRGCYYMDMVGSSELSELAQIPVAVFFQSVPGGTFTFHGSAGEWMTIQRKILFSARYGVMRLYFAGGGVKLKELRFTFEKPCDPNFRFEDYQEYIYG